MRAVILFVCASVLSVSACAVDDADLTGALDALTVTDLARHIEVLASDEFEGRGPSSPGEAKTLAYLQEEFRTLGLEPGTGDSFLQEVPLVAITADPKAALTVRSPRRTATYRYGSDFMAWTKRVVGGVGVRNAEVVFVGYGIDAPEYGWNDYEGVDVAGKVVLMLVNDPGFATQDTSLFDGNAMTYYGRWTYKYEEAARRGAAAAFVIHETDAAGYGWDVVSSSWSGEQFDLVRDDNNMSRVVVEGWLTGETARVMLEEAGEDLAVLKTAATQRGFRSKALPLRVSVDLENVIRRSISSNVVATLPGAMRPDEYVLYMAHWDHLGRDATLQGDQIYNGALDNATGTAGLLLLAKAFVSLEERPERSVVFLAVTAEEQGLLGSAYYASYPVYPLAQTVATINMDGLNILGPMRDVTVIGLGQSELDDYLTRAAQSQSRRIRPDPEAEKGFYFRSDHFSFAKEGVPSLYADAGIDHVEHGEEWTRERRDEYTRQRYHKPGDEFDPAWDLQGAIDDLALLFRVGAMLANERTFPNWRERSPFKATRDSVMAGR
ncbi:MAG: M28 family metallopeptidase [Gemmatimonadota bacterium]|nr:M28 family metallopeptidase [Gemmatimonadota bacterium]